MIFNIHIEMAMKTLFISIILVVLLTVASCSQAEQSTPTTEPATVATVTPTSLPSSNNNSRPLPPTDNGTNTLPDQGMFDGAPVIDLAAAASKLGVTEQQLRNA